MNSTIFKIFFLLCLFCSCRVKQYVNTTEKTDEFINDLRVAINRRKSGVYIYPNLESKFTMKKGNFEGELIYKHKCFPDTLFYAFFEKNKPKGYFINMTYKLAHKRPDYFRYFHNELDRRITIEILGEKKTINKLEGKGKLNENIQKEGFWIDPNYRGGYKNPQGYYKNGIKHGYWEELEGKGNYINGLRDGFWELERDNTGDFYIEKGYYKNDLRDSLWIIKYGLDNGLITEKGYYKNDLREGEWIIKYKFDNGLITEKGYYKSNLREGEWIIEKKSPPIRYLQDDGQWIIGDKGKKVYKEYYRKGDIVKDYK
ncbi:toxin-antitoxin system YwqK family antitoxin [Capnocytophaga canimorsus]|uniref:hypothetical protein n=1 Tax=Capnocytophaga canimorsus TaxID=28188 RepID=UPI001562DA1D|nr:hypothetical protein [Capnocytophaga canimorsus]